MNKTELIELLEQTAKEDLVEDAEIHDHPCSVAIRALNECFDDIDILRRAVDSNATGKSKKVQTLVKLNYDPSW